MERRVKERLIGASILVALIVLVVPELLSGPKPHAPAQAMLPVAAASEPVRTVTVDLGAGNPAADVAQDSPDVQPPASSAQPEAAPGSATDTHAVPTPLQSAPAKPALAKPAPTKTAPVKPPRLESASAPPITASHAWSVQLGSFAKRSNADNLSRQLKGLGYSVYVLPGGSGSSTRYRVRVGPLANRESAERMGARLKSQGHVSSLVAPAA
jgi:DedD protein